MHLYEKQLVAEMRKADPSLSRQAARLVIRQDKKDKRRKTNPSRMLVTLKDQMGREYKKLLHLGETHRLPSPVPNCKYQRKLLGIN